MKRGDRRPIHGTLPHDHFRMTSVAIAPHPLLDLATFTATLPAPLAQCPSPEWLTALLRLDAPAPLMRDEAARQAVRDLLRHGGYKPTGRGKPASEYLVRAADEGVLSSINAAVDACNAVSLHSGLPISVVDLDLTEAPLRSRSPPPARSTSSTPPARDRPRGAPLPLRRGGPLRQRGEGLAAHQDPPRDDARALRAWGTNAVPGRAGATAFWYREMLQRLGARTE